MTEEEIEEYLREEEITLPPQIMEILKLSEEQIKKGEFQTGDEVEKHFDEWLKD